MQHFELSFLGFSALAFATFCHRRQRELNLAFSFSFCAALLAGAVLGKIALIAIFNFYDLEPAGRFSVLEFGIRIQEFLLNFQWALWAGLGMGWAIIFHILKFPKIAPAFFIALFPLMFLPAVVADFTRIVALSTFPLLLQYVFLNADFLAKIKIKTLYFLLAIWAAMPCVWFFYFPRVSLFSWNIAYIAFKFFDLEILPWEFVMQSDAAKF